MMTWQASTQMEAAFITAQLGTVPIVVASDLPMPAPESEVQPVHKESGRLRLLFLSRITPKKNLTYLLDRIAGLHGHVQLTIAGPIADHAYWEDCERRIAALPTNVRASYIGTVEHDDVPSLLAAHHVFALPTLGENFGHVIMEALDSGLGVLVSDQTPWRGLEKLGAGWDLPLDEPLVWEAALQTCCDMDDVSFQEMSRAARSARSTFIDLDAIKRDNLALFGADLPPGNRR
jgi:glycosyltransferase involved in cell wall biosynthesis